MILPILRWPDPRLSTPCAPVTGTEDLTALAADMLETMYAAPGRGLAAPQVGVMKRLFVMDTDWKTGDPAPRVCLNPVIEPVAGPVAGSERQAPAMSRVTGPEGCLSIPGIMTEVERFGAILLHWTALDGTRHSELLTGFAAVCAQHEAGPS